MIPLLNPTIAIVDVDAGVPLAELERAAAALQRQVREHFAPAWGTGDAVTILAVASTADIHAGWWRLDLLSKLAVQGALGYHEVGHLFVSPELCTEDGDTWTSCASHEVLEALADPLLRRCVQLPDNRVAALEVCDQVEGDSYAIDGVAVSNFNTPANFEPQGVRGEAYDYLAKQTKPFEVRPGGYAQVYTPGKGWDQLGEMRPRSYRAQLAALGLGRARRRRRHGA